MMAACVNTVMIAPTSDATNMWWDGMRKNASPPAVRRLLYPHSPWYTSSSDPGTRKHAVGKQSLIRPHAS